MQVRVINGYVEYIATFAVMPTTSFASCTFTTSIPNRASTFNNYITGLCSAVAVPTQANLSAAQSAGTAGAISLYNPAAVIYPNTTALSVYFTANANTLLHLARVEISYPATG
jgi:hypothetical protein